MKIKALIILICSMSALLWLQFGAILSSPNTSYIGNSLDGYKNYWTPAWHVLHDSTYHQFSGINYPYREHVAFTDNQPLISNFVRFVSRNIYDISHSMVAVLNLSMIASILLAAIFIFLLLKKLDLPDWYAVMGAIGIAFLSPQVVRMSGHYALSYCCVIPIFLYLILGFHTQQTMLRSLGIALFLSLIAQVHLYYFGISIFFLIFYFFIKGFNEAIFTNRRIYVSKTWSFFKSLIFNGIHFFVQAVLPYLVINFGWLKIDNTVLDRPSAPSGFLYYRAYLEGIFTSPDAFYYDFVNRFLVGIPTVKDPEGVVYIGLVATFFSIFLFVMVFIKIELLVLRYIIEILQNAEPRPTPENEENGYIVLKIILGVAFILLLLSIGFPFVFKPLEPLLAFTGPLQQFRGIGRFAWVYFYVANIGALFYIYKFSALRFKKWQHIIHIVTILVLWQEAYTYQKKHATFELQTAEKIWESCGEPIAKILPFFSPDIYQAAFPIPYYNVGSENFQLEPQGNTFQYCSFPALQTGLPTMGNFLSRTSLQQAYRGIQMALPPYGKLDIINDLHPTKPILLVQNKMADTSNQYQHLIQKAMFLYENKAIKLYALSMDSLRNLTATSDAKKRFDSAQCVVYQDFEDKKSEKVFNGNGAFEQTISSKTIIFDDHIIGQQKGQQYTCGFWAYCADDLYPTLEIMIRELSPVENKQLQYIHWGLRYKLCALHNGWAYYEIPFAVWFDDSHFEINVTQQRLHGKKLWLDELCIRKAQ